MHFKWKHRKRKLFGVDHVICILHMEGERWVCTGNIFIFIYSYILTISIYFLCQFYILSNVCQKNKVKTYLRFKDVKCIWQIIEGTQNRGKLFDGKATSIIELPSLIHVPLVNVFFWVWFFLPFLFFIWQDSEDYDRNVGLEKRGRHEASGRIRTRAAVGRDPAL